MPHDSLLVRFVTNFADVLGTFSNDAISRSGGPWLNKRIQELARLVSGRLGPLHIRGTGQGYNLKSQESYNVPLLLRGVQWCFFSLQCVC